MSTAQSTEKLTGLIPVKTAAIITLMIAVFSLGLTVLMIFADADTSRYRVFASLGWCIVTVSMFVAFKQVADLS